MEKLYVPTHKFFDILVLKLHQPALLEECGHDDAALIFKDEMKGDLSVNRTRQNY